MANSGNDLKSQAKEIIVEMFYLTKYLKKQIN